jgi:hypothetical protein
MDAEKRRPCQGSVDEDGFYDDGTCRYCGANYHCARCGRGTGMMAHYVGQGKPFSCEEGERFEVIEPEVEEEYFAVEMPPESIIHGVWQSKEDYDRKEAELAELRGYQIPLRDARIDELSKRVAELEERLSHFGWPPSLGCACDAGDLGTGYICALHLRGPSG